MLVFGQIKEFAKLIFRKSATATVTIDPGSQNTDATLVFPTNLPVGPTEIIVMGKGQVTNAEISAGAAISDTKLATITSSGKVANTATTAIPTATANAIVTRDASGNFAANVITAASVNTTTGFSGDGNSLTNLNMNNAGTGTLVIARGGTGQIFKGPAFDALSPTSQKGDIVVRDGFTNVALPTGGAPNDGRTLLADSTQDAGVRWGIPAGGTVPAQGLVYSNGTNLASTSSATPYSFLGVGGTANTLFSRVLAIGTAGTVPALSHTDTSTTINIPVHDNGVTGTLNATSQIIYGAKAFNNAPTVTPFVIANGVVQSSGTGVLSSALLVNANVSGSAAIDGSKIQAANGVTNAGVVSTGAQTFGGSKTFSSAPTVTPFTTANGVLQSNGSGVISSALLVDANVSGSAAIAGSKLQAADGATNPGVVSTGTQTFAGEKTFSTGAYIQGRSTAVPSAYIGATSSTNASDNYFNTGSFNDVSGISAVAVNTGTYVVLSILGVYNNSGGVGSGMFITRLTLDSSPITDSVLSRYLTFYPLNEYGGGQEVTSFNSMQIINVVGTQTLALQAYCSTTNLVGSPRYKANGATKMMIFKIS